MFLASVMAIDIEGFCTMANHLHLNVLNRPDVAAEWSAEQIARKWLQLCPTYQPWTREVAETPSQSDLDAILHKPGRVEQLRLRLSNPSWLMRFLMESLARVANREDQTTGRFGEGRFKMPRLLDEWVVAACLVSVDFNPIRAGPTTNANPGGHDPRGARHSLTGGCQGDCPPGQEGSRVPFQDPSAAGDRNRPARGVGGARIVVGSPGDHRRGNAEIDSLYPHLETEASEHDLHAVPGTVGVAGVEVPAHRAGKSRQANWAGSRPSNPRSCSNWGSRRRAG